MKTLYNLLRIFLYPVLRYFLPLFSLRAKQRIAFELGNTNTQLDIDYIFHISSEGELEQSLNLILDYLEKRKVLVLFTSDSVLKKLKQLKSENSNLYIEAKRVLTYFPISKNGINRYKNIKKFFMVRYDFFPELIFYSYLNSSVLINASLINKKSMNFLSKYYLRFCLLSFDKIIYSSQTEIQRFKDLEITRPYFCFDLRSLRILDRKMYSATTLKRYSFYEGLIKDSRRKIIIGSYWNDELDYLKIAIVNSFKADDLIAIAPHKFSDIPEIVKKLKELGIESIVISDKSEFFEISTRKKIIIFSVPGILCELYSIFDHAHVGGGWHKSIHSVLEPFLMNESIMVSCGKNIGRSTEYEFVKQLNPNRIKSYDTAIKKFSPLDSGTKSMYYNYQEEFINLKSFINNE